MGGKGKGGARAAYWPPERSRPPGADDGGPTITEKIKARKAGGAEAWDEWNNTGWRLDYMLVTPGLSGKGEGFAIYRDERFSDHAPVTIDFNIDFL